jgi:hypothetical protein
MADLRQRFEGQTAYRKLRDMGDGTYAEVIYAEVDESNANPVAAAAGDIHEPAANTAAVVTYIAASGLKHCISGVAWSYTGGDPVGGNLKIEDVSGTKVFSVDITSQGPGVIIFPRPKRSAVSGTAMIITLAAGGSAAITGKLSILGHWTEA